MTSRFLGIDHIGVAVTDLAAATELYGTTLGFEITGGETLADRGIEVCFVATGDETSRIELLGATREDSEISGFLAKRGEGIHHICLRVTDIEAAVREMTSRGARVVGSDSGSGIQVGAHDTRVAFLHPKSTSGVLIELVAGGMKANEQEIEP